MENRQPLSKESIVIWPTGFNSMAWRDFRERPEGRLSEEGQKKKRALNNRVDAPGPELYIYSDMHGRCIYQHTQIYRVSTDIKRQNTTRITVSPLQPPW